MGCEVFLYNYFIYIIIVQKNHLTKPPHHIPTLYVNIFLFILFTSILFYLIEYRVNYLNKVLSVLLCGYLSTDFQNTCKYFGNLLIKAPQITLKFQIKQELQIIKGQFVNN